MKKTLILISEKRYFFPLIPVNSHFDVETIYENHCVMFPLWLRRKKRGLTYYKIGKLGKWKNRIKDYDKLIMFDSSYSKQIDNVVRKNYFEKGVYIYFWNKMNANPELAKKQLECIDPRIKKYSFNKTDCLKYNISYNTTFYYPVNLDNRNCISFDVIFLGAAKHQTRLKELDEICGIFNTLTISSWVHVYGASEYQPQNFTLSMDRVDYGDYLRVVAMGRVILDIDVWKEESCSLRAMEALFFDKKYITNNTNIIKEKFYNSNNIFIIGVDHLENLSAFVFGQVVPVKDSIKEEYLIEHWIERFK